jgi:serine phosphatase RsbU (regulator of sigma subunit)
MYAIIQWHDSFFDLFPAEAHFVFHIFAEFTTIVLSFAIFSIGWYGYKQRSDSRNLALALTFFAVGLMAFAHAFSFPDMPAFLTDNSMDKAGTFFVIAEMIAALGIFLMSLAPAKPPPRWLSPHLLLAGTGAVMIILVLLKSYRPHVLPVMVDDTGETTIFRNALWVFIILLEIGVVAILQKRKLFNRKSTFLLQIAVVIAMFADLPLITENEAYADSYFISHVFFAGAYYFILRAIFVSSLQQPYVELEETGHSLEQSLSSIGAALASSLDLDEALQLITNLASDMLHSKHALVALKREGVDSVVVRSSRGIVHPPTEIPLQDNLAGLVWKNRAPVYIDDITAASVKYHSVIAAAEGLRAAVAAPIMKDEDVLGEIAVYSEEPAAFGKREAGILATFARQAAVAIENARLFESELSMKERMQKYAAQLSILHDIGLQLNRETDTGRLLDRVLDGAMELTSAGIGIMTLIEQRKARVVALKYADWYPHRCEIEADTAKLHKGIEEMIGVRGRESMRLTSIRSNDKDMVFPQGHVPLRGLLVGTIRDSRGMVTGHFMLSEKKGDSTFSSQDEEIMSLLAAQSSVALLSAENFEREHYVAESLQTALLPAVPVREDLEMGLLYRSSGPYGKVGGDFYDFVDLADGRIAVAVGDVCGKGLEAATYTAMVKYGLRAYLLENMAPGDCLSRLNTNIFDQISTDKFITCFLAIIDPRTKKMSFSSAGHLPPIVCRPDGATIISHSAAVPLGVLSGQLFPTMEIALDGVCQLIFYTDGLIEARPQDGEPFGEKRVTEAAAGSCGLSAQRLADGLVAAAINYSGGSLRDDIALLVVRFT